MNFYELKLSLIDNTINKRARFKNPVDDRSKIKGKDLELLKQVTDYLDQKGLSYEIGGSVVDNYKKGSPRVYGDIDILVKNNGEVGYSPSIENFSKWATNISTAGETPQFAKHVKPQSKEKMMYMNTFLDKRFLIKNSETSTTIDLCFEDSNIEYNINGDKFPIFSEGQYCPIEKRLSHYLHPNNKF